MHVRLACPLESGKAAVCVNWAPCQVTVLWHCVQLVPMPAAAWAGSAVWL